MPRTSDGDPRYPKQAPALAPRMVVGGVDLGAAMTPTDILLEIRLSADLSDEDVLSAISLGANRVEAEEALPEEDRRALRLLSPPEREEAVAQARAVTRSRVTAWRRRGRQMTWLELRLLLIGLRDIL